MAEEAIVHADLMSPSGMKSTKDERGAIECGVKKVNVGDGWLAGSGITDIHPLTVDGMAGDVIEDCLVGFPGGRLCDSKVEFGSRPFGKLRDEGLMCLIIFRGHNTAGRVLIESMDDAGALHSSYTGELAVAVMEEGINEGAIGISGCWMDHHAVGFVDHDDIGVFINDREWEILRDHIKGLGLWDFNRDLVACLECYFGFHLRSI